MTGAITGEDIAKFDDAVSCGFSPRMETGTPPDQRERQRHEEQMIRELNEESDAMQAREMKKIQDEKSDMLKQTMDMLKGNRFEMLEDESVWETHPGANVQPRPST